MTEERKVHPFEPIYNDKSSILILGSFPSVKSREGEFFYHHPQNRFWRVISTLFQEIPPDTIQEKKNVLIKNRIALWDVIQSCDIIGSSDNSIKNVIPNNITTILKNANIREIFANGSTAYQLYMKYIFPNTYRNIVKLPSTSPANATYTLDQLLEHWKLIKAYTD